LHGAAWVDVDTPIELIGKSSRPQRGLVVRDETLESDEITGVRRLPVTTIARTAFDLGRHLPRGDAVARLDALMRVAPFSIDDVNVLAQRHKGARGLRNLSAALSLVDGGAASPRETWLRLLLLSAGLPKPTSQIRWFADDAWSRCSIWAGKTTKSPRNMTATTTATITGASSWTSTSWVSLKTKAGLSSEWSPSTGPARS
jgi:hypothetical protein